MNKNELIASLEGRIIGGEMHGGGYIHVPQDEAEAVLELLKAHEPVKPYVSGKGKDFENASTWWYACGNCNKPIDPNDKYCRYCGRKVAWDDDRQGD